MTELMSVLTPVLAASAAYLQATYETLRTQRLPDGWAWEWVVQEDGQTGALAELLPDDSRIRLGAGRHGGPGVARTMALARADGSLIKVLDADDLLTPDALARDIAVLAAEPDIDWTTSRALDLLPDGSTAGFPGDPEPGRLKRGTVLQAWQDGGYRLPVHPATLCIRRSRLMALGGWMALPASEDTGLLLALDAVSDGYFIGEPGLLYRKWPGQATSQATHTDSLEHAARMRIIEERAVALARADSWMTLRSTQATSARPIPRNAVPGQSCGTRSDSTTSETGAIAP